MIKKVLILIFVLLISGTAYSQNKVFSKGEELSYIVYYGFIKLGEVKMYLTEISNENGLTVYSSKSTMKSYSGIPFVNLNNIFESDMIYDGKEIYSKRFKATEYKEDAIVITEYKFNYDSDFVYVTKINGGKTERDEKINFNKNIKFQDGLSLFYSARFNSFTSDNYLIPVFMNEAETSVNYYIASKPEEISISLSDDDINSLRCNGSANFTGVVGLTGEFAGWFSDDDARVHLKSQLNVVIGNVTLELDSYKRKDWKLNT
ncbi:MAG: DUF3108 domain-containing protein [Ignavibacteria bacterium]|nr:DUF3108 domain-containing protein [Ignavibacteria bacterium]